MSSLLLVKLRAGGHHAAAEEWQTEVLRWTAAQEEFVPRRSVRGAGGLLLAHVWRESLCRTGVLAGRRRLCAPFGWRARLFYGNHTLSQHSPPPLARLAAPQELGLHSTPIRGGMMARLSSQHVKQHSAAAGGVSSTATGQESCSPETASATKF